MRRAPIVLTATVVGTVAILTFKPRQPAQAVPAASTGSSRERVSTRTTGSVSTPRSAETVTGPAITTRYGTTQVRVTVSGGRITRVQAIRINEDDPRSYQISVQAVPELGQEVLARQTAAVDSVSGATYTSEAYEASLQAALDRAGYTAPDGSKASTQTPTVEGGGAGGTF